MSSSFKHIISRKRVVTFIAILSLPLAFIYTSYAIEHRPQAQSKSDSVAPMAVSVITAEPKTYTATITANGETVPQFELTMVSEVEGKVTDISALFSVGQHFAAGKVLGAVEQVRYLDALASATLLLEEAQLALLQERQEAAHAKAEWQRAGFSDQTADPLLLRAPQVVVAESKLAYAKASVLLAKQDLQNTQLSVPFNANIAERHISPGQYISKGDQIATLHSTERMDIALSIPLDKWAKLPKGHPLVGYQGVEITNAIGQTWPGVVTKVDKRIDSKTRQRKLVVSIEHPFEQPIPALAGMFVRVDIQGQQQSNLLALPATSMTSRGQVWYVDEHSTIQSFEPEVVFQQQGWLFIEEPDLVRSRLYQETYTILTFPLPSFISGQKVQPKSVMKEQV